MCFLLQGQMKYKLYLFLVLDINVLNNLTESLLKCLAQKYNNWRFSISSRHIFVGRWAVWPLEILQINFKKASHLEPWSYAGQTIHINYRSYSRSNALTGFLNVKHEFRAKFSIDLIFEFCICLVCANSKISISKSSTWENV